MDEKMEKMIGKWFSDRVVEWNQNCYGITTVTVEIHNNLHIHLLVDADNQVMGVCHTYKEEE